MRRITISRRIVLLVGWLVSLLMIASAGFWVGTGRVKDSTGEAARALLLDGQKAKLKVAVHSMAIALGALVEGASPEAQTEQIRKATAKLRFESDESGYYFTYQGTVNVALPTKPELQGKDLGQTKDADGVLYVPALRDAAERGGDFVSYRFPKPNQGVQPKLAYAEKIPGTPFWIGTGIYLDNIEVLSGELRSELAARFNQTLAWVLGVLAALLLASSPLILALSRSISRPLAKVTLALEEIASGEGDLTAVVQDDAQDEVGRLAQAFNRFAGTLRGLIADVARGTTVIAGWGTKVDEASAAVAAGAEETSARVGTASAGVEEVTLSVQGMAAASEELGASFNDVARSASSAAAVAHNAAGVASEAVTLVARLERSSKEINDVVSLIEGLASQTNLLALNATIEAARAGEAGAGFAVVAREVKELAAATARATGDIVQRVQTIQADSHATRDAIHKLSEVVVKTQESAHAIASAVEEQSATTQELSAAASEAAGSVKGIADTMRDVHESAQSSSELSTSLRNAAEQLGSTSAELLVAVRRFKY